MSTFLELTRRVSSDGWPVRKGPLRRKIRQVNNSILKVPDNTLNRLDTDSCRGIVPMQPPMTLSNGSMRHRVKF